MKELEVIAEEFPEYHSHAPSVQHTVFALMSNSSNGIVSPYSIKRGLRPTASTFYGVGSALRFKMLLTILVCALKAATIARGKDAGLRFMDDLAEEQDFTHSSWGRSGYTPQLFWESALLAHTYHSLCTAVGCDVTDIADCIASKFKV
ncbi:hypothetical protein AHAS_Ahas13G0275100 [Arachis hypogaea]